MVYLLIILFAFSLFFSCIRLKDNISKKIIIYYLIIWYVPLIISTFQPFGFYKISFKAYLILLINVLSFTFGFILIKIKYENNTLNEVLIDIKKITSRKYILVLSVLATLHLIYEYLLKYNTLNYTQSLSEMRSLFFSGDLFPSHFGLPYAFLYPAIGFFFESIFFILLFYNRRYFLIIVFGVYIFLLHSLKGSRIGYLEILLYLLFFYFCFKSSIQNIRNYVIFCSIILTIISISAWVTSSKLEEKNLNKNKFLFGVEELFRTVITYPVGSFVAFDYALQNDYLGYFGGYQYGRATFASVDSVFGLVIRKLGYDYDKAGEYSNYFDKNIINVTDQSSGLTWNALYTSAIRQYLDFGVFGVLLFPFSFGLFYRYLIYLYYRKPSFPLYALLSYLFYVLMFTPLRLISVFYYDFLYLFILSVLILYKSFYKNN